MKKSVLRMLSLALAILTATLALAACSSETAVEGYTFKNAAGVEISVGDSDKVIPQLGDYLSKNESASCGGIPGNDCVYTYAGFRVKTTPAQNGNVVCQIELTDDSVKTPEGLYIGMSVDEAKKIMGGSGDHWAMGFSYTKGNTQLRISISAGDGTVTAITYLEV